MHIRLPGFWQRSAEQWFIHADAVFHNSRVRADSTRVNHVLGALDEDGVRAVSDLIGPQLSYDTLRSRLIATYTMSAQSRFRAITQPGQMGDKSPSRLLREMRDLCPTGLGQEVLELFWRQKLPKDIRVAIAGVTGPLDKTTEHADLVWEATAVPEIAATTRPSGPRCCVVFPK